MTATQKKFRRAHSKGAIDRVAAQLRGKGRASRFDLRLVAFKAEEAGVELSPYVRALMGVE